jgi:peroxiredoxin
MLLLASCAEPPPPPKPPEAATRTDPSLLEPDPDLETAPGGEGASYTRRGWLGVEVARAPDGRGVMVRSVVRGSPAERAGIRGGDRILTLGGVAVVGPEDVVRLVGARAPGTRMNLGLERAERERLLAAELGAAPDDSTVMRMSFVDAPAPPLEALDTVQGSVIPTRAGLRGKIVVVEFWAPWCEVCRLLVGKLNAWHERYSAEGVVVLGVTMEPLVSASRAATELGIEYPVAADPSGKTTVAYRANAIPTLFVIDRRGVVRDVLVGYSSRRLQELEKLLGQLSAER